MNLNQIRSFISVSKLLNFTNAAKQNGVPQSTISRQINDLEQQLGVRLFYRTKRDVRLTEEGRTFLPYAQEMLDAAKKGTRAVKQLHDGASGRLSIATVMTSDVFLYKCLQAFAGKYPDIIVDIDHVSCGESLLEETDDPYDFHFLYSDMIPDSDEFNMLKTYTDRLGFLLPKGHPLKNGKLDVNSLKREKFILVSEEENPILYMHAMNYCKTHRFSPNVINTSNDIKSVVLSVSAGLGISILPTILPEEILSTSLDVIPIDDDNYSIDCAVAWKKSLLNPAALLFLDTLHDQLNK